MRPTRTSPGAAPVWGSNLAVPIGSPEGASAMAWSEQASGADRLTRGCSRKRMGALLVQSVPLECFGDPLLIDENGCADCARRTARFPPPDALDRKL